MFYHSPKSLKAERSTIRILPVAGLPIPIFNPFEKLLFSNGPELVSTNPKNLSVLNPKNVSTFAADSHLEDKKVLSLKNCSNFFVSKTQLEKDVTAWI